jgi:hypothetical protein
MIQGTPSASHHESPHMEVHAGIDLMVYRTFVLLLACCYYFHVPDKILLET